MVYYGPKQSLISLCIRYLGNSYIKLFNVWDLP